MAKKNDTQAESSRFTVPEGFEEQTSDLAGTWAPEDGDSAELIPLYASVSDSSVEPTKPSVLITCKACKPVKPCKNRDGEPVTVAPNDLVGIWYKAGMKAIIELANSRILIGRDGELDTGKPSAMVVFRVYASRTAPRAPLELRNDWRKQSRNAPLPAAFSLPARAGSPGAAATSEPEDSDEPF